VTQARFPYLVTYYPVSWNSDNANYRIQFTHIRDLEQMGDGRRVTFDTLMTGFVGADNFIRSGNVIVPSAQDQDTFKKVALVEFQNRKAHFGAVAAMEVTSGNSAMDNLNSAHALLQALADIALAKTLIYEPKYAEAFWGSEGVTGTEGMKQLLIAAKSPEEIRQITEARLDTARTLMLQDYFKRDPLPREGFITLDELGQRLLAYRRLLKN
jgi:hypothetical protein